MSKRKNEGELEGGWKLLDDISSTTTHELEKGVWIITTRLPLDQKPTKEEVGELWTMRPEKRGEVIIWGKKIPTPRYNQSYGKGYSFSGMVNTALPITPLLQRYLDFANEKCATMLRRDYGDRCFNMVFINWYEDEGQYIGYHSDDESQLYRNKRGETLVFSLSFGGDRRFLLKSKTTGLVSTHQLGDGTCLLMAGQCQSKYKHSVPKETKRREKRVNLTFRIFK
jgi:alkylated DNA repair dioxygenase AlkB